MADRITKEQIKSTFTHFCTAFGFKQSKGHTAPGKPPDKGLFLDNAPIYGGWEIRGFDGKGSGEFQPFSRGRMGTTEFYNALWLAIRAMDAKKNRAAGTGL